MAIRTPSPMGKGRGNNMNERPRTTGLFFSSLAFVAGCLGAATPSAAVTDYVSASGKDSNSCTTVALPCLTMGAALTKAVAGGGFNRVVVEGPATFAENVTITSQMEIDGDGSMYQAITPKAGGVAVTINGAPPGASVFIQNLKLQGFDSGSTIGVEFVSGGSVDLNNMQISGFSTAGVSFTPNAANYQAMTIESSLIDNGGCVNIKPTNAVGASVDISNTVLRSCSTGILADATGLPSNSWILVSAKDVNIFFTGIGAKVLTAANSGGATISLVSSNANSGNEGVLASGPKSYVVLDSCKISGNGTGVDANGKGVVNTYSNNDFSGNAADVKAGVTLTPAKLK